MPISKAKAPIGAIGTTVAGRGDRGEIVAAGRGPVAPDPADRAAMKADRGVRVRVAPVGIARSAVETGDRKVGSVAVAMIAGRVVKNAPLLRRRQNRSR